MNKPLLPKALTALFVGGALLAALPTAPAQAAEAIAVPDLDWSFEGITGYYDRASAQRGLQVFRANCAACHGLKYVAFRNLTDLGYTEEEVQTLAEEYLIVDGPDDDGEMFERPGIPADRFPDPFPNEKAAAASNGGAVPPDLSLMAKARANGPDYIHALMVGYVEPPADFELMEGLNYNAYFPGHQIAMAQPIYEDGVEYADGTPASIDQQARDITMFLMWAAEPKLEQRKQTGITVLLFLAVLTGLLYLAKRKIWADLH